MQAIQTVLTLYYLYQLATILLSLPLRRMRPAGPISEGKSRFAVFVPAHNEEAVIYASVRSIMSIIYPSDKFDVFVIADNCTDNTAERAALAGAKVLTRVDAKKGKQFALEWAFRKAGIADYDAVLIVDADNSVHPSLLSALDRRLANGHKVIQAYAETKNPTDNWLTMNYAYMYWYMFRLQMIRVRLGMSAWLAGTGVCISTDILQQIGWHVTTLTDDVEFTCQLLLKGHKVHLATDAIVYDQKPGKLKDSWLQRVRWVRGQTQVCFKYVPRLFLHALSCWFIKRDFPQAVRAFDAVMWVPMQFILLLSFAVSISSGALRYILGVLLTAPVFYLLPLLAERVRAKKSIRYLITSGLFWFTWVPITFYGVMSFAKKGWFRTPHLEQ